MAATVIGGIILTVLAWAWPAAARVMSSIASRLLDLVEVPVWALLVVGITFALALVRLTRRAPPLSSPPAGLHLPAAPTLTKEDEKLLSRLAKAEGRMVEALTLVRNLKISPLRLQVAVERLQGFDLVNQWEDPEEPGDYSVALAPKGRHYVVEHNLD